MVGVVLVVGVVLGAFMFTADMTLRNMNFRIANFSHMELEAYIRMAFIALLKQLDDLEEEAEDQEEEEEDQ